jgi:all-trans-retinol 13,14-reductase
MMHAGAVEHYMNGAYYPVGGSAQIARTIVPVIERAGGHVFTNARVSRLLIEGRRAIGVELDNGHRIFADSVVSSIGVLNTCRRLLDPETRSAMGFDSCEMKLLPSSAHLGLFLGLSKSAEELGLPKTNLWLQPAFDHDATYREHWRDLEQPFPLVYFTFPSAKDPRFQERYPGKATIEIVVPTNHEHFARWADTSWQKRGDEYLQVKRRLFERVMEIVLQELPQIRGHVAHVDFSTPLTTQHFNRASHGEIYGLAHTPWRYTQEWLRPDTPLRSFYMTGQDIFFMGIGPSAVSGFLTAMRILGARGGLRLLVKLKWPRTSR